MSINEIEHNQARITELTGPPPVVRSRSSRVLAWIKNISVVVAFLALGLGLLTQIEQNQQTQKTQLAVCVATNKARAQVKLLWQYIIDESRKATPHPTSQQVLSLARFEAKVNETYAPRKC